MLIVRKRRYSRNLVHNVRYGVRKENSDFLQVHSRLRQHRQGLRDSLSFISNVLNSNVINSNVINDNNDINDRRRASASTASQGHEGDYD